MSLNRFLLRRAIEEAEGYTELGMIEHALRALQRRVERSSLHVGPFLTVAGGLIGLEAYGLGGALLAVIVFTCVVAVAEEREARRRLAAGEDLHPQG